MLICATNLHKTIQVLILYSCIYHPKYNTPASKTHYKGNQIGPMLLKYNVIKASLGFNETHFQT